MICPKCRFTNNATSTKFCPKCGFEYAKFHDIMISKFEGKKKLIYNILLSVSFVLSILGIVFYIVAKEHYYFGVFSIASLCMMNILTSRIGVIDRLNIPKEIKGYVRFLGTVSMIINLANLVVLVLFVVAIFNR